MDGSNTPLLAAIEYDATSNSETQIPFRLPAAGAAPSPFLPPGKIYHVFFSHCREDREWVADMVDRLESAEYGFKCCFADRDFDLGVPVFQNITKCIHASKRTVIVLSPEFLESPWCSYETRITLELDLDTRQRLLIPVMLRNCEVPNFIGRLTYMEVENEHFWDRFVAAIRGDERPMSFVQEPVGSQAIMAGNPFQFNPNFNNTEKIVEVPIYNDTGKCCQKSVSIGLIPDELMRQGLQVTPTEYHNAVTAISKVFKTPLWIPIGSLLIFLVAVGICFCVVIFVSPSSGAPTIALPFVTIFVAFIATASMIIGHKACAKRRLSKAIKYANEILRRCNLLIAQGKRLIDGKSITNIVFMYYDWRPCIVHMNQFLRNRNWKLDQVTQEETIDLLIRHAAEYGSLLFDRRINIPSEQRHTRQGECLCQFVESSITFGTPRV